MCSGGSGLTQSQDSQPLQYSAPQQNMMSRYTPEQQSGKQAQGISQQEAMGGRATMPSESTPSGSPRGFTGARPGGYSQQGEYGQQQSSGQQQYGSYQQAMQQGGYGNPFGGGYGQQQGGYGNPFGGGYGQQSGYGNPFGGGYGQQGGYGNPFGGGYGQQQQSGYGNPFGGGYGQQQGGYGNPFGGGYGQQQGGYGQQQGRDALMQQYMGRQQQGGYGGGSFGGMRGGYGQQQSNFQQPQADNMMSTMEVKPWQQQNQRPMRSPPRMDSYAAMIGPQVDMQAPAFLAQE
jgi:hypothetical protein